MNKVRKALTGAAVLGSLVLGGAALAEDKPKVNAYNCVPGTEVTVPGQNSDDEQVDILVRCPEPVITKRERCVDQFEGNGDCKVPEDALADGIPVDAYKTGLCPTEQLCFNASLAKAQEVLGNEELVGTVGELSDRVDVLRNNVDGHCDRIGGHDDKIENLGENVQSLYKRADQVENYAKSVEAQFNKLFDDEGQFALGKMKQQCEPEYSNLKDKHETLKTAQTKLIEAKASLVDYLTSVDESRTTALAEMSPGALANLAQDELAERLGEEGNLDLSDYTAKSSALSGAAEQLKFAADDFLAYTAQLGEHPCGYEEMRDMIVDISAFALYNGRFGGEARIDVAAPVGGPDGRLHLGVSAGTSGGLFPASESESYTGDFQNGTITNEVNEFADVAAYLRFKAFELLDLNARVGAGFGNETQSNDYEIAGQPGSVSTEDSKAGFRASGGVDLGSDLLRVSLEGGYDGVTEKPFAAAGVKLNLYEGFKKLFGKNKE
jgi:hypothetical protein